MTTLAMAPATRGWVKITDICPACGHKGWCTRTSCGTVVKCQRAQSDHPIKQKDGTTAWLHRADKLGGTLAPAARSRETPRLKPAEVANLIKQHQTAISNRRMDLLSSNLGITARSLRAYGIGYDIDHGCYSFPMVDGERKPIGIRLRAIDGRKFCFPGSRNGLFVPEDYETFEIPPSIADEPHPLLLLLPEGPTDAAAARDMGFRAIGRPSNAGGADLLRALLSDGHKQEVVVVGDRDETKYLRDGTPFWPGIEGALQVCEKIIHVCGRLQFMLPPPTVKDLRQWLNHGGNGDGLGATSIVTLAWLRKARARIEVRKKTEKRKAG